MKKLMLVVILASIVGAFYFIAKDNQKLEKEIYALLEKDVLTEEEKDYVDLATDPDEMKESFVVLDEAHEKMFKEHFGRNR